MHARYSHFFHWQNTVALLAGFFLAGCADFMVQEDLPTIAHVHIGHALTGWKHTPDNKGLFVVAEEMGNKALQEVELAQQSGSDLTKIKQHVENMLRAVDPGALEDSEENAYGVEGAVDDAVSHIVFAAESDDASRNVIDFAVTFEQDATSVINRSQLISAVGLEILRSDSMTEIEVLTDELVYLNKTNLYGDPVKGEIGLTQLRVELDDMIGRENPPYEPVATRYLLGIIRLPDGKWAFSWLVNPWHADAHEGDGDGGGSGY